MTILKSPVDLAQSFERLKRKSDILSEIDVSDKEQIAFALGYAKSAIRLHIAECTEQLRSHDDIPETLFQSPVIFQDTEGHEGAGC